MPAEAIVLRLRDGGVAPAAAVAALLVFGAACTPTAGEPGVGDLASATPRDPGVLIGLDPDGVEAMLGPPDLRRDEAPAALWQYRNEACVLDLYFFPDAGGGPVTVADYAARARTPTPAGGPVDTPRCLGSLVGRAARAMS
jgi:hypothetical protein